MACFRLAALALGATLALPFAAAAYDAVPAPTLAPVTADTESANPDAAEEAKIYAILKTNCQSCHGLDMLVGRPIQSQEWPTILDKMKGLGANLTDADRQALEAYLIKTYSAPPQ